MDRLIIYVLSRLGGKNLDGYTRIEYPYSTGGLLRAMLDTLRKRGLLYVEDNPMTMMHVCHLKRGEPLVLQLELPFD